MSHAMNRSNSRLQPHISQQGFTLVVVLVLLVIMSMLGIAVLRSSAMQERMSANLRDRSVAFQGAEAALRFAQDQVLGVAASNWDRTVPTAANCVVGTSICPTNSAAVWSTVPAASYDTVRLSRPPEFWIEYLGAGPGYKGSCDTVPPSIDCQSPLFRITARSQATGRADVMLQSTISSRIPTPGA